MHDDGEGLPRSSSAEPQLLAAAADGGVGLWWIDAAGVFHADATLAAVWDRPAEELARSGIGAPLCFVHAEDRPLAEAIWGPNAAAGSESAFRVLRSDGSPRWLMCRRNAPGLSLGAGAHRAAGIALDWTAIRERDETQLRAKASATVTLLAGRLAHDFNNLLFAILGNATLALSNVSTEGDPSLREGLREIERAGTRASEIVQRLSAFARPSQPRRQLLKLSPIVDSVGRALRDGLPEGIELRMQLLPEEPSVLVDARMFQELVTNLIANSVTAMDSRQGPIEVAVERVNLDQEPWLRGHAIAPGRYITLRVRDFGAGMDAATAERCTEPFFSTRPKGAGMGLGLSIVQSVAKTHGGGMRIESEPDLGTTVHVYFPQK